MTSKGRNVQHALFSRVFAVVLRVATVQVRQRNTDRLWFPLFKRKSFGAGFQLGPDGTLLLLIKRLNAEVQVSKGLTGNL